MTFIESNIEFDFKAAVVQHIQDRELGHGLKNVDFIIRENQRTLMVEVRGTRSKPEDYLSDDKINEFVEKARDTYTFLHLLEDAVNPRTYVVLIDYERGSRIESAFMNSRHDSLMAKLKGEKGNRWKIEYIGATLLLSLDEFSNHFPNYAAARLN